jgi:hypothetical protein
MHLNYERKKKFFFFFFFAKILKPRQKKKIELKKNFCYTITLKKFILANQKFSGCDKGEKLTGGAR